MIHLDNGCGAENGGGGGGVPPLSTVSLETAGIRVATLPSAPDTHTLLRL
eukprot:m.479375 g.479375  ORF g.479375 m.479375 type:complete len:50 (+) comp49615_c0_seq1:476-625(+)